MKDKLVAIWNALFKRKPDSVDQMVIGKTGQLISPIVDKQHSGAVMIAVRGGSEQYIAVAKGPIPKFATVVVKEYYPPRTVLVEIYNPPS